MKEPTFKRPYVKSDKIQVNVAKECKQKYEIPKKLRNVPKKNLLETKPSFNTLLYLQNSIASKPEKKLDYT